MLLASNCIGRHITAEGSALVAGGAVQLLQAGCVNVQNTANVSNDISQLAHQSMQWHSVTGPFPF